MLPRLTALAAALALVAAACTGSGATTTTAAGGPASSEPAPTTTFAATTTTIGPPPDPPYALAGAVAPGTTVVYEAATTYRQTSSGELEAEDLTIELEGERRHAGFATDGAEVLEVTLDTGAIAVFGTRGPGGQDLDGKGRDGLFDAGLEPAVLDLPVTLLLAGGAPVGGLAPLPGGTGDPFAVARALDAFPGPPLPPGPVDVGDEWEVGPLELPWIADRVMTAAGTARVTGTSRVDGAFTVEVEVDLEVTSPTLDLGTLAAGVLALGPTEARLAGVGPLVAETLAREADGSSGAGTVRVTSGRLGGVYRYDPSRGLLAAMDTDARAVVELALEDESGPYAGSYVVAARTEARLATVEDGARPLEYDADDAAFESFPAGIDGYEYEDVDPARGEEILNRVGLLLDDPLAGVAAVRLVAVEAGGPGLDVVAFYPLGFARGDPALADTLAAVITGEFETEVGERVDAAGVQVLRFESEGETWLVASTNTRLLVGVGGDDAPVGAFAALVASADEHRWQEGECHDVGAGDTFDPPYSPFGHETLVPCWRPHTVEVTGARLLPDGPDAPFPADLSVTSDRFCGESFLAYTGARPAATRLNGISYLPDEAEWAEGDRYLGCVVSAVDDAGQVVRTTGDLRGAGPDAPLELEAGTCFDGSLAGVPVGCTGPHVAEVIGDVTIDAPPGEPYPGRDEFAAEADALCQDLLGDYAEATARDGAEVTAFAFGDDVAAWEAGERTYACVASARDRDGNPVRVLRSFAERWRALGPADDAFSA